MVELEFDAEIGLWIDKTDYSPMLNEVIELIPEIQYLEKAVFPDLFKSLYKGGLYVYGNNEPIVKYNTEYLVNGKPVVFKTYDEIIETLKEHDILTTNGYPVIRKRCSKVYGPITPGYPITEDYIKYLQIYINRVVNVESHILKTEKEVLLEPYLTYKDPIAYISDKFKHLLTSNNSYHQELYHQIRSYLLIQTDLVLHKYNKFNPLTCRLEIKEASYIGMKLLPAISSRIYYAKKYLSELNDHV